jgi:putative tryptophan/tyrosine transport system substrate-binding protein
VKRREFITLIGCAAAWPLAARAQQPERMARVGLVSGFSEAEMRPVATAFRGRLRELGWSEGRNIIIDVRVAAGDYDRLIADAGMLVAEGADVIVAMGTPGLKAVQQHTRTLPVVFTMVADPVGQGLIDNLAHPGGHATGFTNFEFSIGGKWLELLRELDPRITRVTLINNPLNAANHPLVEAITRSARSIRTEVDVASVRNAAEIETAIAVAAQRPGGGLIIVPDSLPVVHRALIVGLAEQLRLPTMYPFRVFTVNGGLISYGLDFADIYRQAANYADRILRGTKPSALPVQAPTKFELIINLKTAKELGLEIPPTLLARADEVIE